MKSLNKRLSKIEREADKKLIYPPEELHPYLEKKKKFLMSRRL
jgi:hypothetical protein